MKWVLVVESSEADREYLGRIINRLGYKLFSARSGEEALYLMNQSLPDALIVGERIPDYDPLELGQAIKKERMLSSAPLLLLTSNQDPFFQKEAGEVGYNEIVQRPMSIRKFFTSLEMCLSNNRRLSIRAPMSFPAVAYHYNEPQSLITHNFGESGIYVATPDPPRENTELDLQFKLPGLRYDFMLQGRVAHAQDMDTDDLPAGMVDQLPQH